MGLFSRLTKPDAGRPDSFTRRREFFLPYDADTVAELITGPYEIPHLAAAPIVEDVYFSQKDSSRIVFTGGNKLATYWNIVVELSPSGGGTHGVIYVDRTKAQVEKWVGNVLNIIPETRQRLQSAGATFTGWELTDIFI